MADWRRLAKQLALADGKIEGVQAALIQKELLADRIIDKDEIEFILDIVHDAKSVCPAFRDFFLKIAKKSILADKSISETETRWLRKVFDPAKNASLDDYHFLYELQKEASTVAPEFVEFLQAYGAYLRTQKDRQ